jgi:hypothetical protein
MGGKRIKPLCRNVACALYFGKHQPLYRIQNSDRSWKEIFRCRRVRDPARVKFWHYLRRAYAQHREKFAEAVRLVAMGYHFRKLTDR